MKRLYFDIEADNLLRDATEIHCIVAKSDCGYTYRYTSIGDISIEDYIYRYLLDCRILIGHNIMGYDLPLIERLLGIDILNEIETRGIVIRDTLVMSKLMEPDRLSHSLESYGIQFNLHKPEHEDWTKFSNEMLHRCTTDVDINELTYNYLVDTYCDDKGWILPIDIEQKFSWDQSMQELEGVDIDVDLCYNLLDQLDREVNEIDTKLLQELPKRVVPKGVEVKKPFKKDGSYSKMVTDWFNKETNDD